jgi:hypothetical protein
MAGSVNKVIESAMVSYSRGMSIPQTAETYEVSQSGLRYHLKKAGILRSRAEGVRKAAADGRLGSGFRGKKRKFTSTHCENIGKGRVVWAKENSAGVSFKSGGYVEYTMGPNKGRSVHVVKMEARLGRPLMEDECVHHIDGNKHNNEDNNLALLTRSGHMRLHQRERRISKGNS